MKTPIDQDDPDPEEGVGLVAMQTEGGPIAQKQESCVNRSSLGGYLKVVI